MAIFEQKAIVMLKVIRKNVAGLDIGSKSIYAAVEGGEVTSFATFTAELYKLRSYLEEHKVETVAMEATGVYWAVVYEILKEAGFDVWLVDGRETKQVPGRKTDVRDCQWIQQLHSYGLLKRCFVAEGLIKELRSFQRLREDHIRSASMHVNHMQKALVEMNIRLPEVLSQVHGTSGMKMIEAILAGDREKHYLLSLCAKNIKEKKADQVLNALEGRYTRTGLFTLKQAHEAYQFYQQQIKACDREIETILTEINKDRELPLGPRSKKRKPIRHHRPEINDLGRQMLSAFDGKDATVLPGITDYTWLQLLSETGKDLTRWPSEKHFTSWLGLSPGRHDSGKKKRSKRKGRPKAGQIFREIAQSLLNSKYIGWGNFARRLRGRKGPAIAIKATARKLAVQYWRLMVKGGDFVEKGVAHYEEQLIMQKQRSLAKLARELNVVLMQ